MSRLNNFKISEILTAAFAMFGLMMFLAIFILLKFFAQIPLGDFGEYAGAVVATIALFVALGGYIGTTRAQRLEYRAYVSVDIQRIFYLNSGNVKAEVFFQNKGRSPAYNLEAAFSFQLQGREGAPIKDPKHRKLTLQAVHGTQTVAFVSNGGFSSGDTENVLDAVLQMQVTAEISYTDIFGAEQSDTFYFTYAGDEWVQNPENRQAHMRILRPNYETYGEE